MSALPRARHEDGLYRVPGGEGLIHVELDGRTFGVISSSAYLDTDGTLQPGCLESWIRTDVRFTRYPGEPLTVRPIVCKACGDTGEGSDYTPWGTTECQSCGGLGDEKNLRTCTYCDKVQYFPAPVLPCAPRQVLGHETLLEHAHAACAVQAEAARIRTEEPSFVMVGTSLAGA